MRASLSTVPNRMAGRMSINIRIHNMDRQWIWRFGRAMFFVPIALLVEAKMREPLLGPFRKPAQANRRVLLSTPPLEATRRKTDSVGKRDHFFR